MAGLTLRPEYLRYSLLRCLHTWVCLHYTECSAHIGHPQRPQALGHTQNRMVFAQQACLVRQRQVDKTLVVRFSRVGPPRKK